MYFDHIKEIKFEGKKSKNPFAFKFYDRDAIVLGKPMKEHLKFSMAYWHTLTWLGLDMFGEPFFDRPWHQGTNDPMQKALNRVDAAFEFLEKLGIEYFCFHDRDIAPEADTLAETNRRLDIVVEKIEKKMKETGIKLLWGTANTFSNARFVNGAGTSPNADIFAFTAAQIKKAMEITHRLNGNGYVFWGGREGYETLLNTNMKREQEHFAKLLWLAVDYKKEIGFKGQLYIEPKPKEPTKHQYDYDAAAVLSFLRQYGLDKHFKLNIEANHATLSGHTMQHELRVAADAGMLGSVDANQGDMLLGWDTDQFPTNIYDTTMVMYEIIRAGGLSTGGLNFDAKPKRSSFTLEDLVLSHIAGMDTFAAGLKIAAKLWEDKVLEEYIAKRYASYDQGIGALIEQDKVDFKKLESYVLEKGTLDQNESGRQEWLESIINQYVLG